MSKVYANNNPSVKDLENASVVQNGLAIVSRGPAMLTKGDIETILEIGRRHKPPGYDEWASGLRLRFEGKQESIIRSALANRYPESYRRMAITGINWLRMFSENDSGSYAKSPTRNLMGPSGAAIEEGPQADRFASILKKSCVDDILADFETKVLAAGTMFGVVDWDHLDNAPRITTHWPADTICVCHMSAPADIRRAYIFAHKITSPNGIADDCTWWRVFTRGYVSGSDGQPAFSPWSVQICSERGEVYRDGAGEPVVQYDGILPVFVGHSGIPHGSIYLDIDRDITNVCDALNVSKSNETYVLDSQGHTPLFYAGDALEAAQIDWGPDKMAKIGGNETIQSVSLSPAFDDMREGRRLALRELAISRSNNPDAYATEPGPPLSGVSRRVQNIQHQRKLERLSHGFVRMEETQLWPIVFDMIDGQGGYPFLTGLQVQVICDVSDEYEDQESVGRRMGDALDRRLISPAAAASYMMPDVYPTTADAVKAGLSDQIGAPLQLGAPVSRFSDIVKKIELDKTPTDEEAEKTTEEDPPKPAPPEVKPTNGG